MTKKSCGHCGAELPARPWSRLYCDAMCQIKEMAKGLEQDGWCWEWPLSRNVQTGYGQLSRWTDGKRIVLSAHRASYAALVGEIPEGMSVCHTCDNRGCWNPAHLFLGSTRDNMRDMVSKGRHWASRPGPSPIPRGEHHWTRLRQGNRRFGATVHTAKLTDADIPRIRESTKTLAKLALEYGVTESTLSAIRRRKTWRHIP